MLDLYAAGSNIDEAEQDLYNEFDASFELLPGLPDTELSMRLLRAKTMMKAFVKEIIQIDSFIICSPNTPGLLKKVQRSRRRHSFLLVLL